MIVIFWLTWSLLKYADMDVFSTAQPEEALPSGWKEVKRYMYMFHVFFSSAGTDNCCFNLCGCYFLFGTQYAAGDGRKYYSRRATGETSWTRPSALTGGLTGGHERQTSNFESNPLNQRDS